MRIVAGRVVVFGVVSLVVAGLGLACGRPSYPASAGHDLYGKPMPEIRNRQTLDGSAFASAQLAGRPSVIKFFAEYCEPCKRTLPAAEKIHRDNPDVFFVGIAEDESVNTARQLVKQYGITFPVIHDGANVLSGRFHMATMPTTFVIDRSGVIQWVGDEKQTEEDLKRAIQAAQ